MDVIISGTLFVSPDTLAVKTLTKHIIDVLKSLDRDVSLTPRFFPDSEASEQAYR